MKIKLGRSGQEWHVSENSERERERERVKIFSNCYETRERYVL
jgi:hypothetical protein